MTPQRVTLSEDGVSVRPWSFDDAPALVARIGDPAIAEFLDRIPQPYTLDDAREYLTACEHGWDTGQSSNFAILAEDVDGPLGSVGIRWTDVEDGIAEIGYWIAAEARRRGIATCATRLVARWAFATEPALERLQLRADAANIPSNRVAEKAGFTREGVLRSAHFNARLGRRVDWVMWSLLRNEL